MNNYIENNDKIAFHPGYYIKEYIDTNDLSLEDFAKKLGITTETLNLLICGEQNLSIDIAEKLSQITSTSIAYWTNLQASYETFMVDVSKTKDAFYSESNQAYLMKSIQEIRSGKGRPHELIEVNDE